MDTLRSAGTNEVVDFVYHHVSYSRVGIACGASVVPLLWAGI